MEAVSVISMNHFSSMDLYSELSDIVGILREALKILLRSGRLIASTTLVTLIPNSLLFLSNIFAIKLLVFDLFSKSLLLRTTDPFAMDFFQLFLCIKEDIQVLSWVKLIFFLSYSLVTLFSLLALLFSSMAYHYGKNFELKKFLLRIGSTWPMPLTTWVYITLMGVCYTLLLAGLIGLLMVISDGLAASVFACTVLAILSISLFLHSAVVWMSGLVISVAEESCYGIETLERAEELMEGGTALHGLALNLMSMVTAVVILIACQLITFNQTLVTLFIIGLVIINMVCLMKIFSFMAHMVFYYQCKKIHEDELELPIHMGYIGLIDVFF
ncbi:hypothetical protein NE237_030020 [Protea cynaroides]|uniref:Uncharacterized protein n=1 Tax=Protea cynaroides TaxID=273540 RepID=A0A9Q0GSX8_9MAGN|nr:hypothetical protein NE237_030020 [Protea cynaroides]